MATSTRIAHPDRASTWVCFALSLALVPFLAAPAAGQQAGANFDLYSIPKNAKTLGWDWYAKDFRELTFLRMPGLFADYRLGVGDELQLTVVGFDGPFNFRVRENGEVVVPLLGPVKVEGLTADEAEEAIARQLRDRGLLTEPEVLLYIASYEAKKFWVYGQVDRPGEYTMSQPLTVMDAIFMAGGLDFYGDRFAYLHRRHSQDGARPPLQALAKQPDKAYLDEEVIKLDLQPMRNGGLLSPNPQILGGDTLYVPTGYPMTFYVLGDVVRPGPYQMTSGERVTVAQALAHAGGPTRTARAAKGVVVRYAADGTVTRLPIDYLSILKGRQPDLALQTNDIVFIPGSAVKIFRGGVMDTLPLVLAGLAIF